MVRKVIPVCIFCILLFVNSISISAITIIKNSDNELFEKNQSEFDLISRIDKTNFILGELIVKYRTKIEFSREKTETPLSGIKSIDNLNQKHGVISAEKLIWMDSLPSLSNIYKFTLHENVDIPSIIKEFNDNPLVEYAEPNFIFYPCQYPNDEFFNMQWGLHNTGQTGGKIDCDIDAPEAWDKSTGNSDIIIAIIDNGIDYNHPDLKDNIWINEEEDINNNGIFDNWPCSEQRNGVFGDLDEIDNNQPPNNFVDDIVGWDFPKNDNNPVEEADYEHGTMCAGIAAAATDNSIGIAGVAWNCKIMIVKNWPHGGIDAAYNSIIYATNNGADVISMSWGSHYAGHPPALLETAIDYAYSQGVVLIASAGNGNTNSKLYPAACDGVIAVGAINENNDRCDEDDWDPNGETSWEEGSNYGDWVDIAAPGNNVYTTQRDENYRYFSGTSAACPFVSGVAGLLLSKNPTLTPENIASIICSTSDKIYTDKPIGGRLNAYRALTNINPTNNEPHKPNTPDGPTIGKIEIEYSYSTFTTDPDGDYLYYKWVWGDGTTTEWLGPYDSGEEAIASHSWNEKGIYDIKVKAMDSHDGISTWSDPTTITVENQPPNKPSITGPVSGKKGIIIEYIFTATDPDNNEVYYYIEWGDEEKEEWFGPYPSGQEVKVNHIWSKKGNYIIKAKAKDTHDLESDWEILEISMIKNKQSIKSYLPQLFEIFSEKWNFSLLNLIKYWV